MNSASVVIRRSASTKFLLVEGPTEVKTIQQWLRLLHKDHEIVLLSLGGNSIINAGAEAQLEEVKRITPSVYALIDSERTAAGGKLLPDRQGFLDACGKAGIKCHILERRATDNYLTEAAVRKVKGEKYNALAHFEDLSKAKPAWGKAENWKIAREMSLADLKGTDLGAFLDEICA